jgi:hypothetical protein
VPARPPAAATGVRPAACKAVCSSGRGRPPQRRRMLPCSTGRAAAALPADADYPGADDVPAPTFGGLKTNLQATDHTSSNIISRDMARDHEILTSTFP